MAGHVKYLTDEEFSEAISDGVTLVDFYADWCGPCRSVAPIIEELSTEMAGTATIAKLDIDKNQESPTAYGVTSIPTLIIFKDGKEVQRVVGIRDKQTLKNLIQAAI